MLVALGGILASAIALITFVWVTLRRSHGKEKQKSTRLKIIFLHPDLGIGGAERLIIDAACGLQEEGLADVEICCNYHDPNRAFSETTDGTLKISVVGSWFPRHFKGRALVLCATVRMLIAAVYLSLFGPSDVDAYIVDQVAAPMIVLRLLGGKPVLFYCHFPDKYCDPSRIDEVMKRLHCVPGAASQSSVHDKEQKKEEKKEKEDDEKRKTATKRGMLHRLYRSFFDRIEEFFMLWASKIVCNSQFTRAVTCDAFPLLHSSLQGAEVMYPPIRDMTCNWDISKISPSSPAGLLAEQMKDGALCVVSINRYERKKNIGLAVQGFAEALRSQRATDPSIEQRMKLFICGGYDPRLPENVAYFKELQELADREGVSDRTIFLRSFTEDEKLVLINFAACVVYTPTGEHFGIVPVEVMTCGRVVVAARSGGPLESVTTSGEFGLLEDPTPAAFGQAISRCCSDEKLRKRIGEKARERALKTFLLPAFANQMHRALKEIV